MASITNHRAGLLPAATAPLALADIPGGEPGLVPVLALANPLRISVALWPISIPTPTTPETLSLFWNGTFVDDKTWEAAIDPEDLFIDVPVRLLLEEGPMQVTYTVLGYNGVPTDSQTLTLTIDRTAPVLGGDRGLLAFPELGTEDVTDDFLNAHGNVLRAQLPDNQVFAPGDRVIYFWDDDPLDNTQVGEFTLMQPDLGAPVYIDYDGAMIRQRGDGSRYAQYEVHDRAGNASPTARPKALLVDAKPIPRVLPWPEVPLAEGGAGNATLALIDLASTLEIRIPDGAVIRPAEPFFVDWGSGFFGECQVPGQEGVRTYQVDERFVATMSGKTIPVCYRLEAIEGQITSDVLQLEVTPLSRSYLPTPALSGTSGRTFKLSEQIQDPAITLRAWRLISTDQRIRIDIKGVSAEGAANWSVMHDHAVTEAELKEGIGADGEVIVPLNYLRSLIIGQDFYVEVKVSFDAGQTWPALPNFQPLEITLLM